jgi:hypothetical protein
MFIVFLEPRSCYKNLSQRRMCKPHQLACQPWAYYLPLLH